MKAETLNPKARETHAKTQIDMGSSLFKASFVAMFAIPITMIVKAGIDGSAGNIVPQDVLGSMSSATFLTLLSFFSTSIVMGALFRQNGLKALHDLESQVTREQGRRKWRCSIVRKPGK